MWVHASQTSFFPNSYRPLTRPSQCKLAANEPYAEHLTIDSLRLASVLSNTVALTAKCDSFISVYYSFFLPDDSQATSLSTRVGCQISSLNANAIRRVAKESPRESCSN